MKHPASISVTLFLVVLAVATSAAAMAGAAAAEENAAVPRVRRPSPSGRRLPEVPARHPRCSPRQRGEGEGGDPVQLQECHERVLGEANAIGVGGRQE
ncbi:hypothetical protein HU200_010975 [Digitaria exilis]|uniref:Uncharacterized protein n=1 Tax=Digitaria exilis TaxID=1010633 RepID=A0A835FI85_9POAL|nr:hypothetical protein HU200_010975 [Digitaria exilis]